MKIDTLLVGLASHTPPPAPGIFAHFTWSEGATILAAVSAALIAAIIAVIGYSWQQGASRRDQRATMYAEALRAVEDYLEAPYRIRRRDGSPETRHRITDYVSDVQSRINFHSGWLSIHAPDSVATAYDAFVVAARQEAGPQMTAAWESKPTRRDRDVPLRKAYDRRNADAAREAVLRAMRADL